MSPFFALAFLLLPLSLSVRAQSLHPVSGNSDTTDAPPPDPAPVPPACTIQTRICTSAKPPFYDAGPPATSAILAHPIDSPSCSVSYTDTQGNLQHPDLIKLDRNRIPCGPKTGMFFQTEFGKVGVEYQEALGGIPAGPSIRSVFTVVAFSCFSAFLLWRFLGVFWKAGGVYAAVKIKLTNVAIGSVNQSVLDAWRDRSCFSATYEGLSGTCYYWW